MVPHLRCRVVLHVRVVTPPLHTDDLIAALTHDPAVTSLVVLPGVSRRPVGDLVEFDVASEAANRILEQVRALNLEHDGTITLDRLDMAFSDAAALAEAAAPGESTEAVIWEEVEARVRDESTLSRSFVVLLTAAVVIGAVGILTDSPILVVGAMVVGPEYGPLSSIALGLHKHHWPRVARGLQTLVVSFPIAIAVAALMTWLLELADLTPERYRLGQRQLTSFISHPDVFSVIVAATAAVAGVVSLTQAKSGALIGVLVSVTTVPAAANIGVALVHDRSGEAGGAAIQLLVNFAVLVGVGALGLRVSSMIHRIPRRARRRRRPHAAR